MRNIEVPLDEIPLIFARLFHTGAEIRHSIMSTEWPKTPEFRDWLNQLKSQFEESESGSRMVTILDDIPESSHQDSFDNIYETLTDSVLDEINYVKLLDLINTVSSLDNRSPFASMHYRSSNHQASLPMHVRYLPRIDVRGLTYGTRDQNIRNSFICFKDAGSSDESGRSAGQISKIFLHSCVRGDMQRVELFFVVDAYASLADHHVQYDPYRPWPLLNTKLFYDRFDRSVVIRSSDILHHAAACKCKITNINEPCIVLRELDRVCLASITARTRLMASFGRASWADEQSNLGI